MAEKPILFSGPMVRAILAGRKTVTRRIAKIAPGLRLSDVKEWADEPNGGRRAVFRRDQIAEPRFAVGDRLWVREAHYLTDDGDNELVVYAEDEAAVKEHLAEIAAMEERDTRFDLSSHRRLRPSIHMPRWASRITLDVTGVKVERLQDISEEDALAEGVCQFVEDSDKIGWGNLTADDRAAIVRSTYGSAVQAFRHLWETINGEESWDANPWVVAIAFKRVAA